MPREIITIPAQRVMLDRASGAMRKTRVAAYCRVSTEQEEQQNSFQNQVSYYTDYITSNPQYELAGVYADEGISGTSTRKREQFRRLIEDCEAGKIDLVITKSISRFARNTQDCLSYSRKLKDMGIAILFEKEGINTMDGAGELLFTILSSLAQEESRSISENCKWGIRSLFQQGVLHMNVKHFYGYDKDSEGRLVINKEQAKVVKWIFESFMDGYSMASIAAILRKKGVPSISNKNNWQAATIYKMLRNEKHMGDTILQKYYSVDYLTKKTRANRGELPQYHIKNDHEPIVSKELWEVTQMELDRQLSFRQRYGLKTIGRFTVEQPFTTRVFCGVCGELYWRRTRYRMNGELKEWICANKCLGKDGPGCINNDMREVALHKSFMRAWNIMVEAREDYMLEWETTVQGDNPLLAFRAKQMIELTKDEKPMTELDLLVVGKTLDRCIVYPMGTVEFYFLSGTCVRLEPEC